MPSVVEISEIERGSWYLTIYGQEHWPLLQASEKLYTAFLAARPELANIQQFKFRHEAGDVSKYHPYGDPIELKRPVLGHFHIRYGYLPTDDDILQIISLLSDIEGITFNDLQITSIEDRRKDG